MAPEDFDYSEEVAQEKPPTEMERLKKLVAEMTVLELERLELEGKTEENKAALKSYQETLIPSIMNDLDIDKIHTKTGMLVEIKRDVHASFPSDEHRRKEAFEYIRKSGNDAMIRRTFTISFSRDKFREAQEFADQLTDSGVKNIAIVSDDQSINHQTLLGFIRRELRNGKEIPLKAFGAIEVTTAKIKGG